jgi:hypothetical protein
MDSSTLVRAAVSGGVFVGICAALGGGVPVSEYYMAAATQVAASWGSDQVHNVLQMWPSRLTSAVVTGSLFTAARHFVSGDRNDVNNYITSAGSEYVARAVDDMVLKKKPVDVADVGMDEEDGY